MGRGVPHHLRGWFKVQTPRSRAVWKQRFPKSASSEQPLVLMRRQVRPRAASRVPGFPTRLALRNAPVGKDSPWTSQPPDWLREGRSHGKGQLAQSPPFTCPSCESPLLGQPRCTHAPPPSLRALGMLRRPEQQTRGSFLVCLSVSEAVWGIPAQVGGKEERNEVWGCRGSCVP